jgi:competence protein ComEC
MRSSHFLYASVAGFLIGVTLRSFYAVGISFVVFTLLLALCCFIYARKNARVITLAIALVAVGAGVVRMHASVMAGDPRIDSHLKESVTIEGVVSQEPDARDASTRISVAADTLITKFSKDAINAGILVQAPAHASVSYGDRIRAFGTLTVPESFDTGVGRTFKYREFLGAQGIGYALSFAQIETIGRGAGNPLKAGAIWLKEMYIDGVRKTLPEPEAGLAGGITAGDKRSIGPELTAAFQRVSLVHMIVLSGYNITVVLNTVAKVFQGAPSFARVGIAGVVVTFFVLMSGGAASATRAGLMALLAVYARASHRLFLAGRILAVVCGGMVFFNPFILAFDPGFQLSALATLGLIVFTPHFFSWFSFIPERFLLREIAASTSGTQLAVLPLLLYQSGTLSFVALPANLLALAPVPLAMLFSFIAGVAGAIFGSYATIIAAPAYLLLSYVIAVAQFFAQLPFAAIQIPAFNVWFIGVAYAILFAGAWALRVPEKQP